MFESVVLVSQGSAALPLNVEMNHIPNLILLALEKKNLRGAVSPFSRGVHHWRVSLSGIRQSEIWKWPLWEWKG